METCLVSHVKDIRYNCEVEGASGVKHRFDVIINNDSRYLAIDVMLNPSSADILSFYIKCFDTKVKNAVLITSKLPDDYREILKNCGDSKILAIELE